MHKMKTKTNLSKNRIEPKYPAKCVQKKTVIRKRKQIITPNYPTQTIHKPN